MLFIIITLNTLIANAAQAENTKEKVVGAYLRLLQPSFLSFLNSSRSNIQLHELENWKSSPITYNVSYKSRRYLARIESYNSVAIMISRDEGDADTNDFREKSSFEETIKTFFRDKCSAYLMANRKPMRPEDGSRMKGVDYEVLQAPLYPYAPQYDFCILITKDSIVISLSRVPPESLTSTRKAERATPQYLTVSDYPYSLAGIEACFEKNAKIAIDIFTKELNENIGPRKILPSLKQINIPPALFNAMLWPNEQTKIKNMGNFPDISTYITQETNEIEDDSIRRAMEKNAESMLARWFTRRSQKSAQLFISNGAHASAIEMRDEILDWTKGFQLAHEQKFENEEELMPFWNSLLNNKSVLLFDLPNVKSTKKLGRFYIYYTGKPSENSPIAAIGEMLEFAQTGNDSTVVSAYAIGDITEAYLQEIANFKDFMQSQKEKLHAQGEDARTKLQAAVELARVYGPMTCNFEEFWLLTNELPALLADIEKTPYYGQAGRKIIQYAERIHRFSPNQAALDNLKKAFGQQDVDDNSQP